MQVESFHSTRILPEFPVTVLEGTYLVWMDCRKLCMSSEELERRLVAEAGLWLNAGTMYGAEGEGFMRWNIACRDCGNSVDLPNLRGLLLPGGCGRGKRRLSFFLDGYRQRRRVLFRYSRVVACAGRSHAGR